MKITKYLQFHDKGAGEVCQVSFSFLLHDNYGLRGDARSLQMAFKAVELELLE